MGLIADLRAGRAARRRGARVLTEEELDHEILTARGDAVGMFIDGFFSTGRDGRWYIRSDKVWKRGQRYTVDRQAVESAGRLAIAGGRTATGVEPRVMMGR